MRRPKLQDHIDLIGIGFLVVLTAIDEVKATVKKMGERMKADFSRLEAEVAQNTDAIDSAKTLLARLADMIRDAGTDQAKLDEIADKLDANSAGLAEAVAANTPADEEPTPEPEPGPGPTPEPEPGPNPDETGPTPDETPEPAPETFVSGQG